MPSSDRDAGVRRLGDGSEPHRRDAPPRRLVGAVELELHGAEDNPCSNKLPVEHAIDYRGVMPRYGKLNQPYVASWLARDEPGGPMWGLNLMKYRERAEYADGRESSISGMEADDVYAPHEHLRKVGSRLIMIAPVVHQLVGDGHAWDRIAIAQYRDRLAMVEMSSNSDFQEDENHKEAGMDFTIVMATFPVDGDPVPPQESGAADDRLLLLQVVGDADRPDIVADLDSVRIGRFTIEDRIIGDDRTFAEARYDLISREVADQLVARGARHSDTDYVVIADPTLDDIARSLTDTNTVLF